MNVIAPGHWDGAVTSVASSSKSPESAENHTPSLGWSDCGRQPSSSADYGKQRCIEHEVTVTTASDNESTVSWPMRAGSGRSLVRAQHSATAGSAQAAALPPSSCLSCGQQSSSADYGKQRCIEHEITVTTASDNESTASWQMRAVRSLKVTDPQLMRAMSVASALRSFASVLSDRPATSEYFSLSTPCASVDTFVSHNWSTPRWKKFLVLAFHFNLHMSLAASFLVAGCMCYLTARGFLPFTVGVTYKSEGGQDFVQGVCSLPAGLAAFFVSLISLHELDRRRHTLFIDRCCVHQVDADLKREGIENLAAFLRHARTFLVLYSEVYMKRLWTTYEVASWLMLHRGRNMLVRPVSGPVVLLYGCLCATILEALLFVVLFTNFPRLVRPVPGFLVLALCVLLGFIAGAWMVTRWTAEREAMESAAKSFSLRDAECKSEEDRRAVQQNILDFMKYSQLTDPEAGEAKVFDTFEDLVHREVPSLMRSSFGGAGVPYSWAIVLGLPHGLVTFDYLAGYLLQSQSVKYMELHAVSHLVVTFVLGPLLLALAFRLTRFRGLRNVTGYIFLGALQTVLLFGASMIVDIMIKKALHSWVWCVAIHTIYAVLALGTSAIYGALRCWSAAH